MCGIVALFSPRGTIAPMISSGLHAGWSSGVPMASAPGSHRTAAWDWDTRASVSSTSGPAISPSKARMGARTSSSTASSTTIERIQRELESRGHRLRTRSDSEIALHLYEELGTGCLHGLRGEYAFALWDESNRRCLPRATGSASSRCSSPCTTARSTSRPRSRRCSPPACRRDGTRRSCSGSLPGGQPTETLFDGVSQVPPGHYLLATKGMCSFTATGISTIPRRTRRRSSRDDRERAERLRATLDEAVRLGCAPMCRSAAT